MPLTINTATQPLNKAAWEAAALVADSAALISVTFLEICSVISSVVAGRGRQRVVRGEDLRYDIQITLEEAVKGTTKDIQINTLAHCDSCDGSGAEKGSKVETCPSCHGSGRVSSSTRLLRN